MKPVVDNKKCFASKTACKVIDICPVDAISYIEVDEPILDKTLNCNCAPQSSDTDSCGCDCGCDSDCNTDSDCSTDLNACGGSPYGRIIIDQERCSKCGVCVLECCGSAIEFKK